MSNIVVHKTTELDVSTNFTNNFLDGLLEQYCQGKYQENTVLREGVPNISLDALVKFAYPGYYCKAPGLYANVATTHVMIVYQETLHNVLQEALSHKLSRLFVSYSSSDVPSIYFTSVTRPSFNSHISQTDFGHRLTRDFGVDYTYLVDNYLFKQFCKRTFNMEIDKATHAIQQLRTNVALVTEASNPVVIYKPTADAIRHLRGQLYEHNAQVLEKSFFFTNTSQSVTPSLWLSLHINSSTHLAETVLKAVGQEYAGVLLSRAKLILSQQSPYILHELNRLEEAKREEEREETSLRLKQKEKEELSKKVKIEESLRSISDDKNETVVNEVPEEDNSFLVTILLSAAVAFLLFLIFK